MKEKIEIKVIAQRTIFKNRISLIAEENGGGQITKGQMLIQVSTGTLAKMQRPLACEITKAGNIKPKLKA